MKDVLTLKEAARYLNIHPEVLRKKVVAGEVPGQKIGTGRRSPWRFMMRELENWLSKDSINSREAFEPRAVRRFLDILDHSDDLDRISDAINSLGLLGSKEATDRIKTFLDSPFVELRWLSVRSLIKILEGESKPLLYSRLKTDTSERVKLAIAGYFALNTGDTASIKYLIRLFKSTGDKRLRLMTAQYLVDIKPKLVTDEIRTEIRSEHAAVRYRGLQALEKLDYPGIEEDLRTLLFDRYDQVRFKTIKIIGIKKRLDLQNDLMEILSSNTSDKFKMEAALALARIYGYDPESSQAA